MYYVKMKIAEKRKSPCMYINVYKTVQLTFLYSNYELLILWSDMLDYWFTNSIMYSEEKKSNSSSFMASWLKKGSAESAKRKSTETEKNDNVMSKIAKEK